MPFVDPFTLRQQPGLFSRHGDDSYVIALRDNDGCDTIYVWLSLFPVPA
jgi:hypothetical protein